MADTKAGLDLWRLAILARQDPATEQRLLSGESWEGIRSYLYANAEKACIVRAIQAFSVDMSAASIFIQESPLQAQVDPESVFRA